MSIPKVASGDSLPKTQEISSPKPAVQKEAPEMLQSLQKIREIVSFCRKCTWEKFEKSSRSPQLQKSVKLFHELEPLEKMQVYWKITKSPLASNFFKELPTNMQQRYGEIFTSLQKIQPDFESCERLAASDYISELSKGYSSDICHSFLGLIPY